MASISVTYTFTNSTTADATQVNTNFTDIINGTSDGTKDFNIGTLTVVGTCTFNGAVTLGDGTPDDISILGSLASSIPIKTNNSFNFGSSTLGLASVYLGSAGGLTTRLVGGATGSSWTITFPISAGSANQVLQTNGSGVTSWITPSREIDSKQNYSFTTSVSANAMTVALKYSDGSDASATNVVNIQFRNATAATGTNQARTVTGALSMAISSGATLGHASAKNEWIYVYAIDNAGTVELAVSGTRMFDEGSILTTGAMSGSATSKTTLYSTSSRSNVAVRYLGRLQSNQTTAGTWTATATESSTTLSDKDLSMRSEVWLNDATGMGAVNTKIRVFGTTQRNTGSAITYASTANNGASFTINEDGLYSMNYSDCFNGGGIFGFSLNSAQLTTDIDTINASDRIAVAQTFAANGTGHVSVTSYLKVGDVIRPHTQGSGNGSNSTKVVFYIIKVNN